MNANTAANELVFDITENLVPVRDLRDVEVVLIGGGETASNGY
jgi:hypothetical protein